MQEHDLSYVRTEMINARAAPARERGLVRWLRTNLFATPLDTVLTLIGLLFVAYFLPPVIRWALIDAVWTGPDRSVCATVAQGGIQPDGWSGACWAFVNAKFSQFMYGRYPVFERWRVDLTAFLFVALLVPLLIPRVPYKLWNAIAFFGVFPLVAFFLLVGGWFGLSYVSTTLWGGLLVTMVLSFVGITVSLPMGILLALGRRSKMPVVKMICVIFIETVRGVPLVVLLFVTVSVLPLLLGGQPIDKMWLVLTALTLHAATSLAEVWRGGLEAVPDGQMEGATALGLSRWNGFRLVVWPQARRIAMPPAIGTIIGAVKDTSLVLVIGIFDMLGAAKAALADMAWRAHALEIYLAVAAFYFVVCFALSVYAERLRTRPYHS